MPLATVGTRRVARRSPLLVELALTAAVTLLVVAVVAPLLRLPPYVDELRIENPHPWQVSIEVIDSGGARTGLGSFAPNHDRTLFDVPDIGERWRFRFTAAGVSSTTVMTRSQLVERGAWLLSVPPEVAAVFRQAAVPETP